MHLLATGVSLHFLLFNMAADIEKELAECVFRHGLLAQVSLGSVSLLARLWLP